MSVGASEEKMKAVRTYAKCLGQAFQIKDDIFDYLDNQQTGKPAGLDLKERKITLPLLGALKMSVRRGPRKSGEWSAILTTILIIRKI